MNAGERKITKKQYERAVAAGGYLLDEDLPWVFSHAELHGYGIYSPRVFERDGDYYVSYHIGDSCD